MRSCRNERKCRIIGLFVVLSLARVALAGPPPDGKPRPAPIQAQWSPEQWGPPAAQQPTGPGPAAPTPSWAPDRHDPEPSRPAPVVVQGSLVEDFSTTRTGALPEGWSGAASVGVRREGASAWLQSAAAGIHEVQSPPLDVMGDFTLSIHADLEYRAILEITLEGADDAPDLTLSLRPYSAGHWTVGLTGAASQRARAWNERANRVRLLREGSVYQLIVNGQPVIAQRMPQHREFRRVRLVLSGPDPSWFVRSTAKVYQIELRH